MENCLWDFKIPNQIETSLKCRCRQYWFSLRVNWYQEKICLRIHKCTEADSPSSPFSTRPTQKVEKMEIIIKSRITTYILPYSLWKSLQKSVLGNESRQPLYWIVGKILSAGAWKKLMSSQFILCKPFQEKQENKSCPSSMHSDSTSKIVLSLSNTKISWYRKTTFRTFHSTNSKRKNIW